MPTTVPSKADFDKIIARLNALEARDTAHEMRFASVEARQAIGENASTELDERVDLLESPVPPTVIVTPTSVGPHVTLSTLGTMAQSPRTLAAWAIWWGDTSIEYGTGAPPETLIHTYSTVATYTIEFEVTDDKGTMSRTFLTSSIIVNPPTPVPTPTPTPPPVTPTPPATPANTIGINDLTYRGSHIVPVPGGGDYVYGNGFALKREPSDAINTLHFIGGAYHANVTGLAGYVYEWRAGAPEIPADPTAPRTYTSGGTIVRNYGNIYGSPVDVDHYKRLIISGGVVTPFHQNAGTNGWAGLGWDSVNNHLYFCYQDTYSNEQLSYHFGYASLDYATGISTPRGSWRLNTPAYKSGLSGFVNIPSSFCAANGLGAKRMGIGFGGSGSVIASGDTSFGPALTAFEPPTSAAELTALASTPLIGYAPFSATPAAGYDRATRPAGYEFINAPALPLDTWPENKWTWTDAFVGGGVWIHGPNKSGFVTFSSLGTGQATYIQATLSSETFANMMHVVSEADLADVANGIKQPYEIQPISYDMRTKFPVLDYDNPGYTVQEWATIATITSIPGTSMQFYNATVTTTVPHGRTTGEWVSIRGTSQPTSYDSLWEIAVVDATTFTLHNNSGHATNWSGIPATGGKVYSIGWAQFTWPGYGIRVHGAQFDDVTKILYLMFSHPNGGYPMVAEWDVNC